MSSSQECNLNPEEIGLEKVCHGKSNSRRASDLSRRQHEQQRRRPLDSHARWPGCDEARRWLDGGYSRSNLCLVSDNVAAVSSRSYIKFLFLRSGRERIFLPPSDGVGTLAGRDDVGLLAWSEACPKPRVFVYRYAALQEMSVLTGTAVLEYTSLALDSCDYLLGLTGVPERELNLWNWKTGQLLASVARAGLECGTVFHLPVKPGGDGRKLTQSFLTLGDGVLRLWSIQQCSPKYRLVDEVVDEAECNRSLMILASTWMAEDKFMLFDESYQFYEYQIENKCLRKMNVEPPDLFQSDFTTKEANGSEWNIAKEENKIKRRISSLINSASNGSTNGKCFLRQYFQGFALFLNDKMFIFDYAADNESVVLKDKIDFEGDSFLLIAEMVTCFNYVAWTESGSMVFIREDPGKNKLSTIKCLSNDHWPSYIDGGFLHPRGDHFVILTNYNSVHIRHLASHEKVGVIKFQDDIACMTMSCVNNLCFLGTKSGCLLVLVLKEMKNPEDSTNKFFGKVVFEEYLTNEEIKKLKLNENWLLAITASLQRMFLINCSSDLEFQTVDKVETTGMIMSATTSSSRLLVLTSNKDVKSGNYDQFQTVAGTCISVYSISLEFNSLDLVRNIQLKENCSGIVAYGDFFFTFQNSTKELIKYDVVNFKVVESISLEHQLPLTDIYLAEQGRLLLFSQDGHLTYLDASKENMDKIAILPIHNAAGGGIKSVAVSRSGALLTIGGDSSVVAIGFNKKEDSIFLNPSAKARVVTDSFTTAHLDGLDTNVVIGRFECQDKLTWLELRNRSVMEKVREKYSLEITRIQNNFENIGSRLQVLIEKNQALSSSDQFKKNDFVLNEDEVKQQNEKEEKMLNVVNNEEKAKLSCLHSIKNNLEKELSLSMEVTGVVISSIHRDKTVRNYPLKSICEREEKEIKLVWKQRKMEVDLEEKIKKSQGGYGGSSLSDVALRLDSTKIGSIWKSSRRASLLFPGRESVRETPESKLSYGPFLQSRAYKYIDMTQHPLYPQSELLTKDQIQLQLVMTKNIVRKLQEYFNRRFQDVFDEKIRVVKCISAWEKDLVQITDEIGDSQIETSVTSLIMADQDLSKVWTVDDSEIEAIRKTCHKLPEVEAELNEEGHKVSETGFLYQAYPPGWDKEIGRDLKPPKFIMKPRSEWSDEELWIAENYEQSVKALEEQQNLYIKNKENQKRSLCEKIEGAVEQFDGKLEELFWLKIDIEKCILAEELVIVRLQKNLLDREKLERQETGMRAEIIKKRDDIKTAETFLSDVMVAFETWKEVFEGLQDKEKEADKHFKKEFPTLSTMQLENLFKFYKKRPKPQSSDGAPAVEKTSSGTKELRAKNIAKQLKAKTISSALEKMSSMFMETMYKKGKRPMRRGPVTYEMSLDELDRTSNCPENVEPAHWSKMCVLRRERIKLEQRITEVEDDLVVTQSVLKMSDDEVKKLRRESLALEERYEQLKRSANAFGNDVEIQAVLEMRQVKHELEPFSPNVEGTELIPEEEVERLGAELESLRAAGAVAKAEAKEFQARIRALEWEHRKLEMQLEDSTKRFTDLLHLKLTREMQAVVVDKNFKTKQSQEFTTIEKNVNSKKEYYNKQEKELKTILNTFEDMVSGKIDECNTLEGKIAEFKKENVDEFVNEPQEQSLKSSHKDHAVSVEYKKFQNIKERACLDRLLKKDRISIKALNKELENLLGKNFPILKEGSRIYNIK